MDIDLAYEDSWELSNAFDDYCAAEGIDMTAHWMSMAEHLSIDDFADIMEEMDLQTIRECVDYFCK